jgi:phenylacetate-CoA ligase
LDSFEIAKRFVGSLRRAQWLAPRDLARYQAPLIERLCRHAALETAFNAERLRPLFANGDPRAGRFLFENWSQVPLLSRAEAQTLGERLHARQTPAEVGAAREMTTSGSSGRPLTVLVSAMADTAALARTELLFEAHGFNPAASLGWIHAQADDIAETEHETRGWSLSDPDGPMLHLSKAVSIEGCVDWLRRKRPRYLMAPPTVIAGIVDRLARDGGPKVRLDRVLVSSEAPPDDLAARVMAELGARLVDSYGGREVGEIAASCPDHGPALHVAAETMLVEFIRPDGAVAGPGELARVVVTPFYNYATPLIRYDIGDLAIPGPLTCACGRTAPLIERVLGRQHALFRFSDGTTRFPVGLKAMGRHLPWLQMQVVQTHLDRIEVRYVPDPAGGPADLAAAAAIARRRLHPDMRIDFLAVARIENGPGGKFEDLISRVGAG